MTTINRPGPYTSTTAYGVYGNRIAGGSSLGPGLSRAYILNQDTGVYTDYDAPGAGTVVTHFEGITGGGRANTYNLVADLVDATASSAPGSSISTRTGRRPGSRSPCRRQRDLGQFDLRQHRDRRLRPEA